MRSLLFVLSALAVIGLAFWAYHENYETKSAIAKAERLQRQIASSRAELSMLRAEWAYLNRPERLQVLAEANFDQLGLQYLDAQQFGLVQQVRFPAARTLSVIGRSVEVSSMNRAAGAAAAEAGQ